MKEITSVERKDLHSVVRHSFLKTALIPILAVELVLLCLYFFSNSYISQINLDLLRSNALETISEISKTEARNIDDQLREISRTNKLLQVEHQELFAQNLTTTSSSIDTLAEKRKLGRSSVFVSSNTALDPSLHEKILRTERMEARFEILVDSNPNILGAYFISWDNVVRIYPAAEDFHDRFSHDFDLTKYNFYYLADTRHNPNRSPVWTDAYLDLEGKGWMLSSLTPVYNDDFLEGVNVLPVTLSTFSKSILSKNLQWQSGALVVDKDGNILTMSRAAERYLGLSDISLYNHKDNPYEQALTQPTEFNLIKQNTMAGMYFSEFFNGSEKSMEFTLQGDVYLVTKQGVSETGWQLFILTPLNVVHGPIRAEMDKIIDIGLVFLGLAVVFYVLLFVYLGRSSKKLADRITRPIAQVIHMIRTYDSDDKTHAIREVNITELDDLLSMNLKIKQAKLRYRKISKQMKVKNEQLQLLVITDPLTQLYNRLKLDEVLSYELARSQRDKTPLTVAMIDIDKFKLVNDTFGHQVGDFALIGVSQILLENIRSTDILGRWGGEEFMLILPNTPINKAYQHANKLRELIESADFRPVNQVTISIGLATSRQLVSEKMLVELADEALYAAKENGRNRVEVASVALPKNEKLRYSKKIAF